MKIDSPETDKWILKCRLGWEAKRIQETCTYCNGMTHVGDVNGPVPCPRCNGSGFEFRSPRTAQPEIPQDLRAKLVKTWDKHWRKVRESNGK